MKNYTKFCALHYSPDSYFLNVGHALQAGLVTGVLHFDSMNV